MAFTFLKAQGISIGTSLCEDSKLNLAKRLLEKAKAMNKTILLPTDVRLNASLMPFYEEGEAFYNQRRGQLDMACANCHVDFPGVQIRANLLSQGMPNGFPVYRLKWQKVGSLHRRFRGCNKQVRATPYAYGADEYVNLELFLTHRANGLPVETPAVRN